MRLQAYRREYPDPEYIAEVTEAFPAAQIANTEQARVLLSIGYKYVDVRPAFEWDDAGHAVQAVSVPVMNMERKWSSEEQKKVSIKSENTDFVKQFEKKFPDKDTPILIGCSTGTAYSMNALEQLDDAGYTNLVGLKGGYYAWTRVWDTKLSRRRTDKFVEDYSHGADSAGIHATGAGFENLNKEDSWVPTEY